MDYEDFLSKANSDLRVKIESQEKQIYDLTKSLGKLKHEADKNKAHQQKIESNIFLSFTVLRGVAVFLIIFIFIAIDCNIILEFFYFKIEDIFSFTAEQWKSLKYIFFFLTFQLIIFSSSFGFSSIVKLIEAISNAIRGKKAVQVSEKND